MRGALAENAQRTLDLQYYMVREDVTTQLLLHSALRAADRGVRVRLLIDDLYAVGRDFDLAAFGSHVNVEVRLFNPFQRRGPLAIGRLLEFLADPARLNRRMHNKLWIADNAAAVVGGRNLGDEYFDASAEMNFADLDVLAAGPVVQQLSRGFDEFWNSEWSVPVQAFVYAPRKEIELAQFDHDLAAHADELSESEYARALRESSLASQLLSGQHALTPALARALYDPPSNRPIRNSPTFPPASVLSQLRPLVASAERDVLLISPYFIPSLEGMDMLSALTRRGVRVRVLTNSLASTDVPAAHAGYARRRVALLKAGVQLFEMRPRVPTHARISRFASVSSASLHTKAMVIDGRLVVLGSMNIDPRSRNLNTELAVVIESETVAASVMSLFDEATDPVHAYRVVLAPGPGAAPQWIGNHKNGVVSVDSEPEAGLWRRLIRGLSALLGPEELM